MNSGLTGALGAAPLRTQRLSGQAAVTILDLQDKGGSLVCSEARARPFWRPGIQSTTIGGWSRSTGNFGIAIGSRARATGLNAIAIGGWQSSVEENGASGTITASGVGAMAFGRNATASGDDAVSFGRFATASGQGSFAIGAAVVADRAWLIAFSSATNNGAIQGSLQTMLCNTTDATPTRMQVAGFSRYTINSGKVFSIITIINGVRQGGSDRCSFFRILTISNVSGTTTLHDLQSLGTDYKSNLSTDIAITANDTNDSLEIDVTGVAGQNWRWHAVLIANELTIP